MSTQTSGFNPCINGLRGFCVALVFIYHVVNSGIVPQMSGLWTETGNYIFTSCRYGVEIFFMISGYVIIGSLRHHRSLKSFFLDRVLRTFPTWIPIHLTIFVFAPLVGYGIFKESHTAAE